MRKRLLSIFFALAVLSVSLVYFLPMAFAADSPPVFGSDTSDTTATTGDAFDFEINVTDDYTITNVYVDYWFGAGSHTNTTMSPSGYNYTYSIVIPSGSTDTLHYIFHAVDNGSQWSHTSQVNVLVTDNDDPSFSNIQFSPNPPTTGDSLTAGADITDNIAVDDSTVLFHYHFNVAGVIHPWRNVAYFFKSGSTYSFTITMESGTTSLDYYFAADDTSSNSGSTTQANIVVTDNDDPSFTDNSAGTGTTGDSFLFDITPSDNIGISGVTVTWSHGSLGGTDSALSNDGDGTWSRQITLDHSTGSMTYTITVTDTSSNTNVGSLQTVTVTDNDAPTFVADHSPSVATTGDPYTFSAEFNDNVDGGHLAEAYALYTYGGNWSNAVNKTLTWISVDSVWNGTITVEERLDTIYYNFSGADNAGKWVTSSGHTTNVLDNDPPLFGTDSTPKAGTTGDDIFMNITVSDNIGVSAVHLEYWFGTGSHSNVTMNWDGMFATYTVQVPWNSTDSLHYIFHAKDTSNLWANTSASPKTVPITDNDAPRIFSDSSPTTASAGSPYLFKVMALDNIQLTEIKVYYEFSWDLTNRSLAMDVLGPDYFYKIIDLPTRAGTITYQFWAKDVNLFETWTAKKVVDVLDTQPPSIEEAVFNEVAFTGNTYGMSIDVTDDVDLDFVRMYYYYGEEGEPEILPGISSGDTYSFQLSIPDELTFLYFRFEVADSQGNMAILPADGGYYQVEILDDDDPQLGGDQSNVTATTGDPFMFRTTATDNIGVEQVVLLYTLPNGTMYEISMQRDENEFFYEIIIPNNKLGELLYNFTVWDTSDHWVKGPDTGVTVEDDEMPVPAADIPLEAFQHEVVTFDGTGSTDNVGIFNWTWEVTGYEDRLYGPVVTFAFDEVGEYKVTLNVKDGEVRPGRSVELNITIRDADDPTALAIGVPEEIGCFDTLLVNASDSTDNVGVAGYGWKLVLPDFTEIIGEGMGFTYTFDNVIGNCTLLLTVYDLEGNMDETEFEFFVYDNHPPVATTLPDLEILEGTTLPFVDEGSFDNIEVVRWVWEVRKGEILLDTFETNAFAYQFDDPADEYNITLTVFDLMNNSDSSWFVVRVTAKDRDFDTDGDGIPDWWEEENGLDKMVDDADRDPDGDLISNYREYKLKTHPKNPDTDGDKMPDNWEINNSLDPLDPTDAAQNPDGDELTNLEEYLNGRNPLVKDDLEEAEDYSNTYLVLGIAAIIVVLAIVLIAIFYSSRLPQLEDKFTRNEFPHLYTRKEEPKPEEPMETGERPEKKE